MAVNSNLINKKKTFGSWKENPVQVQWSSLPLMISLMKCDIGCGMLWLMIIYGLKSILDFCMANEKHTAESYTYQILWKLS